jgi:hypothetical protein
MMIINYGLMVHDDKAYWLSVMRMMPTYNGVIPMEESELGELDGVQVAKI